MSEQKKKYGIPKYYYWAKNPPKPKTGFVNDAQKKFFYIIIISWMIKISAFAILLFVLYYLHII
jgi:hypothetical protein